MIIVLAVFSYLALSVYLTIILSYLSGWLKTKSFEPHEDAPHTKISIVVPFRNEEKNLPSLIKDLLNQNYSINDHEIIMVDDHSTDNSITLLETYRNRVQNLKILNLPDQFNGKKQALDFGIRNTSFDLILTTDADCTLKKDWIKTYADYYKYTSNPKMIIGLVDYKRVTGMFSKIQNIEFLSLIGSGAGAVAIGRSIFCNGANLFFEKKVYLNLNDPLNSALVSGDDTFLLHRIKKQFPQSIRLLKSKNAIVETEFSRNVSDFFNQRIRWASKARFYKDTDTVIVSGIVFLSNFLFILSLILIRTDNYKIFIPFILIKFLTDGVFLYFILSFFDKIRYLMVFPIAQLLYPFYIISSVFLSFIKSFTWKGRTYKNV